MKVGIGGMGEGGGGAKGFPRVGELLHHVYITRDALSHLTDRRGRGLVVVVQN